MKKFTIVLIFTVFVNLVCFCQIDNFYFYKGEKINLTVDESSYYITYSDSLAVSNLLLNSGFEINSKLSGFKKEKNKGVSFWNVIKLKNENPNRINEFKKWVKENSHFNRVEPIIGYDSPIAVSEFFYVKLKKQEDIEILRDIAVRTSCEIIKQVEYMNKWYVLKAPRFSNSLNMANYFHSTTLFENVDPGFLLHFSNNCIDDDEFEQQWGLENVNDIDVDVCEAWNFTRGSSCIVVGVLDQGIDIDHNEFTNNISNLSLDAQDDTSPSQLHGNHGTHVAGIIGANQNENQISGIAPLSTLMSISHPLTISPTISQELASGISWAWQNGADIINNSWGDQGGAFYNDLHSIVRSWRMPLIVL